MNILQRLKLKFLLLTACIGWHGRRCDKINAAIKRIANAKKDILLELNSELLLPVSCNSSSPQKKKRKLNHPMRSPDETKSALDWEDLIIEYLLLRGVSQKCTLRAPIV